MGRIELAANRPEGDPAALAARIAANPKDFDARFALAAIQAYEGDFTAAFDQLLEVVMRDKAEAREKARLQLVEPGSRSAPIPTPSAAAAVTWACT
jgi:putative thioredoxin